MNSLKLKSKFIIFIFSIVFLALIELVLLETAKLFNNDFSPYIEPFTLFIIIILILLTIFFYIFINNSLIKRIEKLILWADTSDKNEKQNKEIEKYFDESEDELGKLAKTLFTYACNLNKSIAFFESFQKAASENNLLSRSDLHGRITYANDVFCFISGYTKEELIGKPHSIIRHPDTPKEVFQDLWSTIQSKKPWSGILKNRKKDGGYYWIKTTISPMLDEHGDIVEYVAIRNDITELVKKKEEMYLQARRDPLTGYANRVKLFEDIQTTDFASLALVDIDNFKEINNFYGDEFGNKCLITIATYLKEFFVVEGYIELYRIQGDQFAILNKRGEKETCIASLNKLVKVIHDQTFIINLQEISIQVTTSLSFEEKNSLLSSASLALNYAKKQRQDVSLYSKNLPLTKEYETNLKWTTKLKQALHDDRLVPFYQVIVNNHNGKWEKYECLVRIIDDDGQIISPFFFLDIAKRTKNYINLTKTVIQKSFETFKDGNTEFAINLTIQDIMDKELQEYIFTKLEEFKIGARVVFEIVESESIENFDDVVDFISKLKTYSCKISIDDFGTGYSNFAYLLQLQADYIKIDGSLIVNLATDKNAKIIVATIVDFAQKMGMKTIAEYVENETLAKIVKEMGVDYSQGYFYSEPKAQPQNITV